MSKDTNSDVSQPSSDQDIELSEKGIKIPYRRYLSDRAAGFILVLILITAYYSNHTILGINFTDIVPPTIPAEVRVFVFLLLFLLTTPIGLIINVLSWAFLEIPQKYLEKRLFELSLLKSFVEEYMLDKCKATFALESVL